MTLELGLFGCGTIGTAIAEAIADDSLDATIGSIYDRHDDRITTLIETVGGDDEIRVVREPVALADGVDLVVEAAGQQAVASVAVPTLERGCDLLVLSVGALADRSLYEAVLGATQRGGGTLYVPSGAIAGLDSIKAAAAADELEAVSLTTTKPPESFEGAPHVVDNEIDLAAIDEPRVIFEGPATGAAASFPANINVAIALSLAGIGPDRTTVRIVADPAVDTNCHHIEAVGGVGQLETTVRNVPSPTNPKTSYLAPLSAIEKLRGLTARVNVGT